MPLTPDQIAEKWSRNLGNATQTITAGVNAVTVNPAERAAARQEAYLQGVQRAVADGKYARGLGRVTLSSWRSSMLDKGVQRIATGATQAKGKFATFMTEFMPHVQRGVEQLPPRGTLEQNVQRAIQMINHNAEFRRSG